MKKLFKSKKYLLRYGKDAEKIFTLLQAFKEDTRFFHNIFQKSPFRGNGIIRKTFRAMCDIKKKLYVDIIYVKRKKISLRTGFANTWITTEEVEPTKAKYAKWRRKKISISISCNKRQFYMQSVFCESRFVDLFHYTKPFGLLLFLGAKFHQILFLCGKIFMLLNLF